MAVYKVRLKESLWDSSRVQDLYSYYFNKYGYIDDDKCKALIKKQMEKEGSILPHTDEEFDKAFRAAQEFEEEMANTYDESLKESFSKFGNPTSLQTFIDQFDPTGQGSKSAYLKTVSAMIKKYNCTRDEAKAVLADWFSWEDPDLLKESLDSDIHELENFMGLHYYGLPDVKLQDVPSEELKKMRDIARRALDSSSRSYGRYSNDKDSYYMRRYRKYLDLLNDALKIARDKEAGVYDIKRQIEKDLWSIVVPLYGMDWTYRTLDPDKLKELRQKYKDNSSLFNRLVKDVHRSLNSTD